MNHVHRLRFGYCFRSYHPSSLKIQFLQNSKFLIQSDEFELEELIRISTLFCFITDLAKLNSEIYTNRKAIPITDKEANVTYHLIYRSDKK